jgi:integrase
MARRRFQNPKPRRRGAWWVIDVRKDVFEAGKMRRSKTTVRLTSSDKPANEAKRLATEFLRKLNNRLETFGNATNFGHYIESTYKPLVLPLMASTTQNRTNGILRNYLMPKFGDLSLGDLSTMRLQAFFNELGKSKLGHESIDKIRDVLSSLLRSAVTYGVLEKNPMDNVRLPPRRRGKKRTKPYLTPEQFDVLVELIPEPYATMVYVAVFTGLRISELIGLRWDDIGINTITIDERCSRGDWGAPKSECSNATIPVNRCVIERIEALKGKSVSVRAGTGTRVYQLVKSHRPDDLVFQSVKDGRPMRDNNILSRFIKPAARKLGLDFVNWRCLRTSHATWLKMAGADVKDAQAQLRHSRASTTLDIYQQFVPESQRVAVDRLTSLSKMVN